MSALERRHQISSRLPPRDLNVRTHLGSLIVFFGILCCCLFRQRLPQRRLRDERRHTAKKPSRPPLSTTPYRASSDEARHQRDDWGVTRGRPRAGLPNLVGRLPRKESPLRRHPKGGRATRSSTSINRQPATAPTTTVLGCECVSETPSPSVVMQWSGRRLGDLQ